MGRDGGKRLSAAAVSAGLRKYKFVLLTAALGMFLLLLPSGGDEAAAVSQSAQEFDRLALQREMEQILSSLDGVGRLSLMLTVEDSGTLALAQDETRSEQTEKTETVILGSGAGAEVVVTQRASPRFLGALVVCEGGGSAAVRLRVTQAVGVLTGLSSERIAVIEGKP